jgi:hypothetical protein
MNTPTNVELVKFIKEKKGKKRVREDTADINVNYDEIDPKKPCVRALLQTIRLNPQIKEADIVKSSEFGEIFKKYPRVFRVFRALLLNQEEGKKFDKMVEMEAKKDDHVSTVAQNVPIGLPRTNVTLFDEGFDMNESKNGFDFRLIGKDGFHAVCRSCEKTMDVSTTMRKLPDSDDLGIDKYENAVCLKCDCLKRRYAWRKQYVYYAKND